MTRMKAFAGVLFATTLLAVLGLAAPASANEVKQANCQTTWPPIKPVMTFKFTGSVFYSTAGTSENVQALGFLISGSHTGGKSDVGFSIRENGAERASGHTPDNLKHDQLHIQPVSATVAAASIAQADFRTAFDIFGPDPHCSANVVW